MTKLVLLPLARFSGRHPAAALAVAAVLILLALIPTASLEIKMNFKDLLSPQEPAVAEMDRIMREYAAGAAITVAIKGGTPERMAQAADLLVQEVTGAEEVSRAFHDPSFSLSPDGQMYLISVIPAGDVGDITFANAFTEAVESVLQKVADQTPDLTWERTGFAVVARDEEESVFGNLLFITLLALVGILAVFCFGLRSISLLLLAPVPLVTGLLWTLGIHGLVFGEFNMLSLMFPLLLLGLGIDFVMHYAVGYSDALAEEPDKARAAALAMERVGPGMAAGALTTVAAFFALMVSVVPGFRQFGFVAGVSVLAALLAVALTWPAMLGLIAGRLRRRQRLYGTAFLAGWGRRVVALRRGALLALLLVAAAGFLGGTQLQIQKDVMAMEPKGLPSVQLQREIVERYGMSMDVSYFTAPDVEIMRNIEVSLRNAPTVQRVESALPLLQLFGPAGWDGSRDTWPAFAASLSARGQAVRARLDAAPDQSLSAILQQLDQPVGPSLQPTFDLEEVLQAVPEEALAAADLSREDVAVLILTEGSWLSELLPQVEPLLDALVSRKGEYLVVAYPAGNVWNSDFLDRHITEVTRVAADNGVTVTGLPVIWDRALGLMFHEVRLGGSIALVVILIILILNLRSPLRIGAALLPLVVAGGAMAGIMATTGLKVDIINILAFPLLLGVGIDYGVHLVHALAREGRTPEGVARAMTGTGRAILLTAATTLVGFGALSLSIHRGMAGLGIALSIGITAAFIAAVLGVPALLGQPSDTGGPRHSVES